MSDKGKLKRLKNEIGSRENFYTIEKHCGQAIYNLRRTDKSPRMYILLENLLKTSDFLLDYDTLERCLIDAQKDFYFNNDELCSVNDYISIIILHKLPDSNLFDNCVKTLRFLDIYDFDELYNKVSHIEKLLREGDPVYEHCDINTKRLYRKNIAAYAKHHGISQIEAAHIMASKAGAAEPHTLLRKLYFPLIWVITAILFILTVKYIGRLPALFLIIPLSETVKCLCDFVFGRLAPAERLPRLKLNSVPDNVKTLTVITALLFGKGKDDYLFTKLENFYLSNKDKNLRFGILGDLKDSNEIITPNDEKIIEYAIKSISELNLKYGDKFYLFIRRRSFSATEQRYMGWERKRGAVIELTRLINGGETTISTLIGSTDFLSKTKYVVTLDSDTNLYINAVKEMLGTMLHPLNKPVITGNTVTSGYAIMQPRMDTTLNSASKTPYSVMLTGSGGIDVYSSAAFDIYQSIFGEGIFCGKGIFDVKVFSRLIDNAFPEDSVLSHDLLEGTRLRAAYLSDIALTDSCPKNPLSYYSRLHRWIRGDIQALPFADKTISSLSKYKIYDNLRRIMLPISAVIAMAIGLFYSHFVPVLAVSYMILPAVISLFTAFDNISRRFFSFVIPGIWHSFCNFLYNTSALLHLAILTADACVRSFIRMLFTHRHMLQWVTASEHDFKKPDGLLRYVVNMLPSIIVGAALFIFAPFGSYKVIGLLWFLLPLTSWMLSREYSASPKISDSQKSVLARYAYDMWQYYADYANEMNNWLPPDNYQLSPVEVVAHRTSPTNIGLYMLSCLAACDFGFITNGELNERLAKVCLTIDSLPKWHGHLYNWYDIRTLDILGTPYVSTVDSGNYVTALIALKEGLTDCDIKAKLENYINLTDFTLLYNNKRNLFYIGYDTVNKTYGENCYDLFMSEARTTSYYAVAAGIVPKEHWGKLSRTLITKDGYLGLISWTGTAFEYFMPPILLPVYKNSLTYEALNFAVKLQCENSCRHLWGRSESGFFAFDSDMNYQYKAFGVQKLGLKHGLADDNVIAPYSSFLTLCAARRLSLENLNRLCEFGMYGKYGFYEAVDFTDSRVGSGNAVIRSYMAHHVGMSITAAANACFDNIFNRRFMSNPQMASAGELLQEKIPVDAPIYENSDIQPSQVKYISRNSFKPSETNPLALKAAVVSNNKTKIIASSAGDITITDGRITLADKSFKLKFITDGIITDAISSTMSFNDSNIKYLRSTGEIKAETVLSVCPNRSCINLNLSVEGKFSNICPMLFFTPILTEEKDYKAHPAFSKLSIESEYLKDENILLYKRRPRLEKESELWLAVTLENTQGAFEFETRKDDILPLMYSESDIDKLLTSGCGNTDGACINPVCVIKKQSVTRNGKYECDFLIAFAKSKNEVTEIIKSVRASKKRKYKYDFIQSQYLNDSEIKYSELLLTSIVYKLNHNNSLSKVQSQKDLWKYGISGDLPIACIELSGGIIFTDTVKNFVLAYRSLTVKGIRFDFIIMYHETVKYREPIKDELLCIIKSAGCELMKDKKGGIHLINTLDSELLRSIPAFYTKIDSNTTFESIYHDYQTPAEREKALPPITKIQNRINDSESGFCNNGYTVIKGLQRVPWSYIYTSRQFGTLLTQNSLGFTWCGNSGERRLTPWSNDTLLDCCGERLILNGYDLCAISNKVEFNRGCAIYSGTAGTINFKVQVGIDMKFFVKLICVELSERSAINLVVIPAMGVDSSYPHLISETYNSDTVFYKNYYTQDFAEMTEFVTSIHEENGKDHCFLLGVFNSDNDKMYTLVREKYKTANDLKDSYKIYADNVNKTFEKIQINTGIKELDTMMNFYLPYQALYTRMLARTGFYQSSGAYGFRDQLQDSLAAIYFAPELTKYQIYRCAAHQYIQGDVQHWWHNIKGISRGVRTKCSDDYLWLPYVTALYTERTGDYSILDTVISYIDSEPLTDSESERYETPSKSKYKESLYMHCVRAIEHGFRYGKHGLPLIGSCDWNDGFSKIGADGKGESVWLAWFLRLTLREFIPICKMHGDNDGAAKYVETETELADNIEKHCWDGEWYARAFFGDGTKLGSKDNTACKIDILPQAFAAVVDGATERSVTALNSAFMYLYDTKFKLFKLFTPPFRTQSRKVGYIEGYVPGIRENGGQYSHAAVWGAWGLLRAGDPERSFEVLTSINPAVHELDIYRAEPYAFAGDVYTNPDHYGRAGWSHYTGAAAWYYRIVLEELLGYKSHGEYFTLEPKLPRSLDKYEIKVHRSTVRVTMSKLSKTCITNCEIVNNKYFYNNLPTFIEIDVEKK